MSEQIDWSRAPEGATHYNHTCFDWYKVGSHEPSFWNGRAWAPARLWDDRKHDCIQRPTTPSWSGEGLPPAGVACKIIGGDSKWWSYSGFESGEIVTVRHSFKNSKGYDMVVVEGCDGGCLAVTVDCVEVIRTPEQIAEDERDAAIKELQREMMPAYDAFAEPLLDVITRLGYRKP